MSDPRGFTPKLPIGSNRAQCGVCGLYFGSVAGFDMHRVTEDGTRRCLTVAAMRERGMAVNEKGYWVTQLMGEQLPFPTEAA